MAAAHLSALNRLRKNLECSTRMCVLVGFVGLVSGCVPTKTQEERYLAAEETCNKSGYPLGTPEFESCMGLLRSERETAPNKSNPMGTVIIFLAERGKQTSSGASEQVRFECFRNQSLLVVCR
jgi:hypothetical protein